MTPVDPAIGREIGSYQIVELLGAGGMGRVYRAKHPHIGKEVAVKLLRRELSSDSEVATRFLREARAVNEIRHENLIDVIDFGQTPEGECYIIMECLSGQSLSAALKSARG